MSKILTIIGFAALLMLSVACGSGSSSSEPEPFTLTSPTVDQTVDRGDIITFTGTVAEPDAYDYLELYFDLDDIWDNGNEGLAALAMIDGASMSVDWDTLAMDPEIYYIAIVLSTSTERVIGYADITVTVQGEQLFTLLAPSSDQTLAFDDTFIFQGTLRSVDRFDKVELYLDTDRDWDNGNSETMIISTTATTDIDEAWAVSGVEAGTYYLVIALYMSGGGRLVGYLEYTLTVEAAVIPS